MSWSLRLRDGDLVAEGAHLATVTSSSKLLQDLRLALLEPIGTDNLHPEFGSSIEDVLGEEDLRFLQVEIESEIFRIVRQLQVQQLNRTQQDRHILGKSTLDLGEVILNLSATNFTQIGDRLNVEVIIATGSDEQINVTVPIDVDFDTIAASDSIETG